MVDVDVILSPYIVCSSDGRERWPGQDSGPRELQSTAKGTTTSKRQQADLQRDRRRNSQRQEAPRSDWDPKGQQTFVVGVYSVKSDPLQPQGL